MLRCTKQDTQFTKLSYIKKTGGIQNLAAQKNDVYKIQLYQKGSRHTTLSYITKTGGMQCLATSK